MLFNNIMKVHNLYCPKKLCYRRYRARDTGDIYYGLINISEGLVFLCDGRKMDTLRAYKLLRPMNVWSNK